MDVKSVLLFVIILMNINPVYAVEVGELSPNLFGRDLDDNLFRLNTVKGVKVVNFFWVECLPCSKELPELSALEKKYPRIEFIAIHVSEGGEGKNVVQNFVDKLVTVPTRVILSSPMVKETFGFDFFPHTIVIGADDKVKANLKGYSGKKSIRKLESVINAQ